LPQLRQTMRYVSQMAEGAGIIFESAIHHSDFLALVVGTEDLFTEKRLEPTFTHAILNPPYKKISTDGKERKLLSRIGIEVSNIYAGFVALSLKLLVDGGELVAITPRSFCNGPYFKAFRHFLLH
jgi:adenine-specific DNA-methyltransferase